MDTQRDDEGGFTLIELLVVIGILAIISFPLTEAFIVGLKTTDANASDMSRSVGVQAAQSYFTGDAQSATAVSAPNPPPTTCATAPGAFLRLSWTDQTLARDVYYSAENVSLVAGEGELVRSSCTNGGPADRKMLGRFSFDPGPLPQLALCDDEACPLVPASNGPRTITLKIPTNRPAEANPTTTVVPAPPPGPAAPRSVNLTVRRRTT